MGAANDLLAAVAAKLGETSFGSATVEVQLLPEVRKKNLTDPLIVVALQGKTLVELCRGADYVSYQIGVALNFPVTGESQHADGVDMVEDIHDWISASDNRKLTTGSGDFCLVPPLEMEGVFDPTAAREAGFMLFVTNFNYRFFKSRN